MLTKEINNWLKKVEIGAYTSEDVITEFSRFSHYLTKDELNQIVRKLKTFKNVDFR